MQVHSVRPTRHTPLWGFYEINKLDVEDVEATHDVQLYNAVLILKPRSKVTTLCDSCEKHKDLTPLYKPNHKDLTSLYKPNSPN